MSITFLANNKQPLKPDKVIRNYITSYPVRGKWISCTKVIEHDGQIYGVLQPYLSAYDGLTVERSKI